MIIVLIAAANRDPTLNPIRTVSMRSAPTENTSNWEPDLTPVQPMNLPRSSP